MTTKIETIKALSEELLDDTSPREQRLGNIVRSLERVWAMGKEEGLSLRD